MDGKFTIEEGNLIAIYVGDTPDRKTAVDGIESIMSLIDDADIYIDDGVMIGPNCNLITCSHPVSPK